MVSLKALSMIHGSNFEGRRVILPFFEIAVQVGASISSLLQEKTTISTTVDGNL